jgi:hypothetical protein
VFVKMMDWKMSLPVNAGDAKSSSRGRVVAGFSNTVVVPSVPPAAFRSMTADQFESAGRARRCRHFSASAHGCQNDLAPFVFRGDRPNAPAKGRHGADLRVNDYG